MSESGTEEKSARLSEEDTDTLIRYPALSFSEGLLCCVTSPDGLTVCTRLGYKTGFYKKLFLIDSAGNRFEVIHAEKVRRLFRFRFREVFELITGNPRWQVRLVYGRPSSVALAEVKQLVAACFRKDQEFWEEMCDFEEFRDKLAQSESLEQIFRTFRQFNQA
jgi:hypothetical protein